MTAPEHAGGRNCPSGTAFLRHRSPPRSSSPERAAYEARSAARRRSTSRGVPRAPRPHGGRGPARLRAQRVEPALVEEVVARAARGRLRRRRRVRAPLRRGPPQPRRLGLGADRAPAGRARRRPRADPRRPRRRQRRRETAATTSSQAACELLARRFPIPPETPRDLERALGFLVRKGYELELAHDALRRHANADDRGLTRPPCNDSRMALWHRKPKQETRADPLEAAPPFPDFPYHPDPREHGLDRRRDDPAARSVATRYGYVYVGPVFARRRHDRRPVLPLVHR